MSCATWRASARSSARCAPTTPRTSGSGRTSPRAAGKHADAPRSLRASYVDAGTRDEWYLDLGAVAFRDALAEIGVTDVACELFDAAHGGIDYRYPHGLAYLAERLAITT